MPPKKPHLPSHARLPNSRSDSENERRRLLKKQATAAVGEFTEALRRMTDLAEKQIVEDHELKQKLAGFRDFAKERIQAIADSLDTMVARAKWNRMNVALFGETQHGKSTLLECLTNGNGARIGTGRKDHTRKVRAARIHGMTILDLPGIEGDEQTVLEQITKGLHRSHVILHVIPCDKAPERLTIARVCEHLRNEVMVFAAINVFGSPGDFQGAPPLHDLKSRHIKEIDRSFREQIGRAYQGNFVVAGRVAHAAVASGATVTEKVRRDRAKAEGVFGSLDAARNYSGLPHLERRLVDLRDRHFHYLPVLTTLRIAGELDHVLLEVAKRLAGIRAPIEQVIAEVHALPEHIYRDVDDAMKQLATRIGSIVDAHRNDAIEIAMKAIDDTRDRPQLEADMERLLRSCSEDIQAEAKALRDQLDMRMNRRLARVSRRIELVSDLAEFSGDVDLVEVFERLKITFTYVLREIGDALLSIGSSLLLTIVNPILGLVAAIVGVAKKIWDWWVADPQRRKREARDRAAADLESQFSGMKDKCSRTFAVGAERLRVAARKECAGLVDVANSLDGFRRTLEGTMGHLRWSKMQLATAIVGYLAPRGHLSAYLDSRAKRAIILARDPIEAEIRRGLDGFEIEFCDTPLALGRATFAERQDAQAWQQLAQDFLSAVGRNPSP